MTIPVEAIYHECVLPTAHPEYRTQDQCRGCNLWRALASPEQRTSPVSGGFRPQHASGDDICTIIGCEVC